MAMIGSLEAARRRHIIECTIRVIARGGLAETSLSRVAREAKVAKGIICYYFQNKDGLFAAVLERLRERTFLAAVAKAELRDDAWARISAFVGAHLRHMRERRLEFIAMRHLAADVAGPDKNRILETPLIWHEQRAWLANVLIEGQHSGAFKQFDVEVVAGAISGAIESGLGQLAQDPKVDLDHCSKQLLALFEPGVREVGLPETGSDAYLKQPQAPRQGL